MCDVSKRVAGRLYMCMAGAVRKGPKVWGGTGKCVYKSVFGDGERRTDVR